MNFVETLTSASRNKKQGNHRVEVDGRVRRFYYFRTCICEVDDYERTVKIDNSYGTVSTTKNCTKYLRYIVQFLVVETVP